MGKLGLDLSQAGLSDRGLTELFGGAWAGDDVPVVLDRYRAGDPRAALARVFVLGERVARNTLPLSAEALAEAGLVELDGETVVARVRLTPFAGLLIAHDTGPTHPGFVTGVNAASRTLATLTVRTPVERGLDLVPAAG